MERSLRTAETDPIAGQGFALRSKESWARWVNLPASDESLPVDPADYANLGPDEQGQADRARRAHNATPVIVRTSVGIQIENELQTLLELNRHAPPGARSGAVIDGPPTVGKSTLLAHFGRRYELDVRATEPERFTDPLIDHQPVVYITAPAAAHHKSLAVAFADYLNVPRVRSDNTTDLTFKVAEAIERCGTELIMIDDLHFINLSVKEGQAANNFLKQLANTCPATFVYAGVELHENKLFNEGAGTLRDTQTSGRFTLYSLAPYTVTTAAGRREWIATIKTLEDHLRLHNHEPESLARKHWRYLHDRTRGRIASLSQLIRLAALKAMDDGSEKITQDVLDRCHIHVAADGNRRSTAKPKPSTRRTDGATGTTTALAQ